MVRETRRDAGGELARAAREYIEAHSAEKFSLQAMAGALFVNPSYLLRVFKAHTGDTPLSYHNRVRCERAKALLLRPNVSVSAAGEAVGFVSSAHFSHVFKKVVGASPTAYRLAHLGQEAPRA